MVPIGEFQRMVYAQRVHGKKVLHRRFQFRQAGGQVDDRFYAFDRQAVKSPGIAHIEVLKGYVVLFKKLLNLFGAAERQHLPPFLRHFRAEVTPDITCCADH